MTDWLQIYLFELPKYVPLSENRVIEDPIEQWLYFFRRVEESTAKDLAQTLDLAIRRIDQLLNVAFEMSPTPLKSLPIEIHSDRETSWLGHSSG